MPKSNSVWGLRSRNQYNSSSSTVSDAQRLLHFSTSFFALFFYPIHHIGFVHAIYLSHGRSSRWWIPRLRQRSTARMDTLDIWMWSFRLRSFFIQFITLDLFMPYIFPTPRPLTPEKYVFIACFLTWILWISGCGLSGKAHFQYSQQKRHLHRRGRRVYFGSVQADS